MNTEIWKEIPGYEGSYEVSNLGRVKSLHLKKEKILKPSMVRDYHTFNFSINGVRKKMYAHQLVAMAFLNHEPQGYNSVIDHKDLNKKNNNVDNLRIVTVRENNINKGIQRDLPTGVSFYKNGKFRALIGIEGKQIHLGYFKDPLEASEKYQQALKKYEEEKR